MKITIVGPGAIGCLLAAFLSKSKEEIWLLDKNKERTDAIKRLGISVEGVSGKWNTKVNISDDAQDIGTADLVIIATKSYDTKPALNHAKPLIGQDSSILTLQNGIGNIEIISEVTGPDNVIGGITNLGATLIDDTHIKHAGNGETVIGKIDGSTPVILRQVRELFNKVKLETKISRDIKGILWSKLVINSGINALTALTRLHNGRLVEFEGTRKILREAVTEALKIAKRKRIKLIYEDPLAKVEAVCEATSGNISSMLQDVLRRKKTEIDFINGVVVRFGQELGIPVPVNSMLVSLVKTLEESYDVAVG